MDYLSLLIPIAYLTILLTSLATFSSLYRRRKQTQQRSLTPYFPPHTSRNIYLSLLHLPNEQKIPDSVLRAALLNRAVEDIRRIIELRTRKGPLQTLQQRGIVGDEIWQRLLRAEQEMEIEVKDVVSEANALSGGSWGQTIFQSANEMAQNQILRKKLDAVRATVPAEKARWEEQRERSRRELEGDQGAVGARAVADSGGAAQSAAASTAVAGVRETPSGDGTVPASTTGGKNKKKKTKK